MDTDVAVVGGGIAGASVAFHLGEATDRDVCLLERGDPAGETTARSAAFFGFYGSEAERRMKRYGMARYNEFAADPRADPHFDLVGRLRVATTTEGARDLRGRADDPGVEYLDPGECRRAVFLPELDADAIAGALYRPGVGYFRPRELALEFLERAREAGAAVEAGTPVEAVAVEDGAVAGVETPAGRIEAGAVVCAAGPWTAGLARGAGVDLPVERSLAPILRVEYGGAHTLPIVSHHESGVYVRGHEAGVLIGHYPAEARIERDPDAVDDAVPGDLRETIWGAVESLLPSLADATVAEEWVGVRSHTPDGHPIAGPAGPAGFSVVAFNSSGIQLAPAAGRAVAARLAGAESEFDDAVSPARFDL